MQTLGGNTTNVTTLSLLILIINNIHEVLYSKLSFSNANPIFIHAGTTCSVNFWRRVSTSPRWSWYAIYILKVIQYAWKSSLFSFFKTINPCFLLTTKAMVPNKLNGIYLFDFGTMALPLTTNYLTIALFLTKRKKITKEWENFFFSHANTSLKSKGIYYHNEIYFRDIFFVLFCKLFMFCFIWICFRQLP